MIRNGIKKLWFSYVDVHIRQCSTLEGKNFDIKICFLFGHGGLCNSSSLHQYSCAEIGVSTGKRYDHAIFNSSSTQISHFNCCYWSLINVTSLSYRVFLPSPSLLLYLSLSLSLSLQLFLSLSLYIIQ